MSCPKKGKNVLIEKEILVLHYGLDSQSLRQESLNIHRYNIHRNSKIGIFLHFTGTVKNVFGCKVVCPSDGSGMEKVGFGRVRVYQNIQVSGSGMSGI